MYALKEIIECLVDILASASGVWTLYTLHKTAKKNRAALLLWGIICMILGAGPVFLKICLPSLPSYETQIIVTFSALLVYLYVIDNELLAKKIFTYFMVNTAVYLVMLAASALSIFVKSYLILDPDIIFLLAYLICLGISGGLFYIHFKEVIKSGLNAFDKHMKVLAMFSVASYISVLLFGHPWETWTNLDLFRSLSLLSIILCGYILAFYVLLSAKNLAEAQREAEDMNRQMDISEKYYNHLAEQIEQVKVHNHDLKHHFLVLNRLYTSKKWTDLGDYISQIGKELPVMFKSQYCSMGAVNALLDHYANLCQEENIPFICEMNIPKKTKIQPIHLCIILGNALQNAVEAQHKLTKQQPYIYLETAVSHQYLVISILNPCDDLPVKNHLGQYQSTKDKPGHGLGLQSMIETAKKYHGWCGTEYDEGIFKVEICLFCQQN